MTRARRPRADLHLHTDRSDGRHAPAEVLRLCALGGLDIVALTDHDIGPTLTAGPHRVGSRTVHLLHGVEVSGLWKERELHLLVYFPGEMPGDFHEFLRQRAAARAERYDRAVRSIDLPGLALASDAARAGAVSLTRHHLARALVQAGHTTSVDGAFGGWLRYEQGHVARVDLPFAQAIERAREAGGLCSWAHPPPTLVRELARPLARAGLHALEAARPGNGRHYRDQLLRIAHGAGLMVSGGSDWHGWRGGAPGAFSFPWRESKPILRALGL